MTRISERARVATDVGEAQAVGRDRADDAGGWRRRFAFPASGSGRVAYFVVHQRGLMPIAARDRACGERLALASKPGTAEVLARMSQVAGGDAARIRLAPCGGSALGRVLERLYRPSGRRLGILVDPSLHGPEGGLAEAAVSRNGRDPLRYVARLHPVWGETSLSRDQLVDFFSRYGHEYSVAIISGVDPSSGALADIDAVTDAAHDSGCAIGWELSSWIGGPRVQLDTWGVDFAIWQTAGLLGGGTQAPSCLYAGRGHESMLNDADPLHSPQLGPSLDLLGETLAIYGEMGPARLESRRVALIDYLISCLRAVGARVVDPLAGGRERGYVVVDVAVDADRLAERLRACDVWVVSHGEHRLQLAPGPLYTNFRDCWFAADQLGMQLRATSRTTTE